MKLFTRHGVLLSAALALGSIALSACSSEAVVDTAKAALEMKLADALVQSGTPASTVLTADLDEQESQRVVTAIEHYQLIKLKYSAPESMGEAATVLLSVASDYATLYGEYSAVRQIVQAHWSEYAPAQQIMLRGFHDRATRLHESVQAALVHQQEAAQAASGMLSLGQLIAETVAL